MKWMLDRIGRLFAAYSQKSASDYKPITPADPHQTDLVPSSAPRRSSDRIELNFDAKRKELGVEDGLKDIPGVTTQMLVAFGEHGIKSIEDLADCATDYVLRGMGLMHLAKNEKAKKELAEKGMAVE